MQTQTRVPRRILVRGSKFKVGQRVRVDGDATGDYVGRVTQTHVALEKLVSSFEHQTAKKPGVTVLVSEWEGMAIDYKMEIVAWDEETSLL